MLKSSKKHRLSTDEATSTFDDPKHFLKLPPQAYFQITIAISFCLLVYISLRLNIVSEVKFKTEGHAEIA